MGFFKKIQDRKGRAARLGGVFQGREHRLGILMAALVLTAAAVCGRSGGRQCQNRLQERIPGW